MKICSVCGNEAGFLPHYVNGGYICNVCLKSLGLNTFTIGVNSIIGNPTPILKEFSFAELKELIDNKKILNVKAFNRDQRAFKRSIVKEFNKNAHEFDGASINFKSGQISKNNPITNTVQEILLLRDLKSYEVISNDNVMNNHKGAKIVASGVAFGIIGAIAAHGLVNRDGAQFLNKLNIKLHVGNSTITIKLVDPNHAQEFNTEKYNNTMRTLGWLTGEFDKIIESNGF